MAWASTGDPAQDPWLKAIDAIRQADAELRSAMDDAAAVLGEMRDARVDGASPSELLAGPVYSRSQDARRHMEIALLEYQRALMIFRARFIRGLVDQGMNFTEIGNRMGISRQLVTSLYKKVAPRGVS